MLCWGWGMVGGFLWLSGGVVGWRYVVSVATVGGGGVRGWLVGVLGGGWALGVVCGFWCCWVATPWTAPNTPKTQTKNITH